jgi:hypothetical protein
MRVDCVSLVVPFPCEDLIVRIISNGFTWDSSSSSHIHVDQDGKCVCPVDFGVSDDVIIAVYSSSFVKPIASVAFHTLVSALVPFSCCCIINVGFQFLPPACHTMVLPLEELDLHSFQPDPRMAFQVFSLFRLSSLSADSCLGERCHVADCPANHGACVRRSISVRVV